MIDDNNIIYYKQLIVYCCILKQWVLKMETLALKIIISWVKINRNLNDITKIDTIVDWKIILMENKNLKASEFNEVSIFGFNLLPEINSSAYEF